MGLTKADKTRFGEVIFLTATAIGLLSGVAQFAEQWTQGGWHLLIAAVAVVAFLAGVLLLGVMLWNRRLLPAVWPVWAVTLGVVVLSAATGGIVFLSFNDHSHNESERMDHPAEGTAGPPTTLLTGGVFFDADGDGLTDGYLTSGMKNDKPEPAHLMGWTGVVNSGSFPIYQAAPTARPEDCRQHSGVIPTIGKHPKFGNIEVPDSVTPGQTKICLLTRSDHQHPKKHWVMITVIGNERTSKRVSLTVEMTVVET